MCKVRNDISLLEKLYQKLEILSEKIDPSVVIIGTDEEIIMDDLVNKPYNHGILTNYLAMKLGHEYLEDSDPLLAGINLSRQGCVVIQVDADFEYPEGLCLCFFPDEITEFQKSKFLEVIKNFDLARYQYFGNEEDEGFLSYQEMVSYIVSREMKVASKIKKRSICIIDNEDDMVKK